MSAKITGLVWDHAPYGASTLLTLLALADAADDAGQGSTALATLAHLSRQTATDTLTTLRLLEDAGLLTRVATGDDPGTRVRYRLRLGGFLDAEEPTP